MRNQYCYGSDYGNHTECRKCTLKRWCRQAKNPAMLSNSMRQYNEELGANSPGTLCHPADLSGDQDKVQESQRFQRTYTHEEVCRLVESLFKLDFGTLELLSDKLQYPVLPITLLARNRKVCRQTVYDRIKVACEKVPELRRIFKVREQEAKKTQTVH